MPQFNDQHITATADNRFILAWGKYYYGTPAGNCTSYCLVNDIYYAVRDSNGNQVKAPAAYTHDTAGYDDGYSGPTLTQVSGDRALLAFSRQGSYGDIYYAVLDSSGSTVKGMTNLSSDGNAQYDYSPDAVQLSNGKVAVAWTTSTSGIYPNSHIQFAVLDTMYNRIVGPNMLNNPETVTGDDCVSVAADASGRAVLTWTDYAYGSRRNLYYALVNGDGAQVTSPLIFHTSQANYSYMKTSDPANGGSRRAPGGGGGGGTAYIETSCEGYGNTSYSWTPASGVDGAIILGSPLASGAPGGLAKIGLSYSNHGSTIATNVVLTATLDSHLTYSSDTSSIVPAIVGNNVIWNLPDMALYDGGQFMLRVNVPFAAIGTRYPVTFTLASAGPEANSTDNMANAEVMVAYQVYLPLIAR